MRIVFLFNVQHKKPALDIDAQAEAEFDEPSTIRAIHDAITANGYECTAMSKSIPVPQASCFLKSIPEDCAVLINS